MADKLEYAEKLAWEFPCYSFEDDDEGFKTPHYTYGTFRFYYEEKIAEMGLSEEEFYKQESIIPVLDAYGLDKEKFWYAVVYVAFLTHTWSLRKVIRKPLPSPHDQLVALRDEIQRCAKTDRCDTIRGCSKMVDCLKFRSCHEFKVVFESRTESHSLTMGGDYLMRLLADSLNEMIERAEATRKGISPVIPSWRDHTLSRKTEETWYAANMFKLLFKLLDMPVLRSRNVKKEFRTIAGEEVQVRGKDAMVSYDKNQLIAELIHFLGLTDNSNLDGNSIRSILKSDREFKLDIF